MTNILSVYFNAEKVLDYDKNTRLPGKQRQFLDGMDRDMDKGIKLNDVKIEAADTKQRTNYVVMNLLYGIEHKNEAMISSTCAYLVNRTPGLNQIRATENSDEITLDLIFNK